MTKTKGQATRPRLGVTGHAGQPMSLPWHRFISMAGLLVLVTIITYLPVWRDGFVFDDGTQILHNRLLKASDGLSRIWFTTQAPDYYPLTWSLLWSEWHLWGNQPMGYHVVNVLLHAVAALLVWLVLRRLKIPGAWLAAAVFAIHPVNVATVAWVSEQKSTMAMLFYAGSILLYLKFDEEGGWRWFSFSLAAFLLALLSKSAVVMLPIVLLGCMWWQHGRVRWKDFLRSLPFFVLALILGLTTIWFQHNRALGGNTVRTDGFLPRLMAAGWVPWFYLSKALWPLNLIVIYPKWEIDASRWISWLPGIALICCFVIFWRKRESWGRSLLFGFGYFVVTLFPVLGFFDQGFYHYSLVADHWQYFSIIGVIALVVSTGDGIHRRLGGRGRLWITAVSGVVLVALATATWQRNTVYADNQTLWRNTLATNPKACVAHINLAVALAEAGNHPEAISHLQEALQIDPNDPSAHYNLAVLLATQGKISEAIAHYQKALRLNPQYADACNNLAWLLATTEKSTTEDYAQAVQLALRLDRHQASYLDTLAAAYAVTGRFQDALASAQEAVKLARVDGQSKLASDIEARARLYRDGKPYRE